MRYVKQQNEIVMEFELLKLKWNGPGAILGFIDVHSKINILE